MRIYNLDRQSIDGIGGLSKIGLSIFISSVRFDANV